MKFVDYPTNPNDDSNTSIAENSNKKESITSFSIREPYLDFSKLLDKLEQAEINMKLEYNRKRKVTTCEQYPNYYFTVKQYQRL